MGPKECLQLLKSRAAYLFLGAGVRNQLKATARWNACELVKEGVCCIIDNRLTDEIFGLDSGYVASVLGGAYRSLLANQVTYSAKRCVAGFRRWQGIKPGRAIDEGPVVLSSIYGVEALVGSGKEEQEPLVEIHALYDPGGGVDYCTAEFNHGNGGKGNINRGGILVSFLRVPSEFDMNQYLESSAWNSGIPPGVFQNLYRFGLQYPPGFNDLCGGGPNDVQQSGDGSLIDFAFSLQGAPKMGFGQVFKRIHQYPNAYSLYAADCRFPSLFVGRKSIDLRNSS